MASIKSIGSTVFTIDATVTLARATQIAAESGQTEVTPEHILLSLLEPDESRLRKTLDLFSIAPDELQTIVAERSATKTPLLNRISADAKRVVLDAFESSGRHLRDFCDNIYLIDPYWGWYALSFLQLS